MADGKACARSLLCFACPQEVPSSWNSQRLVWSVHAAIQHDALNNHSRLMHHCCVFPVGENACQKQHVRIQVLIMKSGFFLSAARLSSAELCSATQLSTMEFCLPKVGQCWIFHLLLAFNTEGSVGLMCSPIMQLVASRQLCSIAVTHSPSPHGFSGQGAVSQSTLCCFLIAAESAMHVFMRCSCPVCR